MSCMRKTGTFMTENPIKRHKALQPLSRDHHHGLLLSWKIRQGFKNGIDPERMMVYVRWFWDAHLLRHFELEEKQIFPVLGNDNPMVKRALREHRHNYLILSRKLRQKNSCKTWKRFIQILNTSIHGKMSFGNSN